MSEAKATVRVLCRIPGASSRIGDITFASVEIEGETLHVSERVERERADRLLGIAGFELYEAPKGADRAIDQALAAVIRAAVVQGKGSVADTDRRLDELRAANKALAGDLQKKGEEVERLTKRVAELAGQDPDKLMGELLKLREENQRLRADLTACVKKPEGDGEGK